MMLSFRIAAAKIQKRIEIIIYNSIFLLFFEQYCYFYYQKITNFAANLKSK